MISLGSMWAIALRHIRVWKHDPNYLLSGLYWPVLDILIWGFLGAWIARSAQFHNYELVAFLGVLLWQIVGRGCNIMCWAFTEELWSNNVVNIFSLPLAITNWMGGVILYYAVMMGLTTITCIATILALYDVSLWQILWNCLIFIPPLFIAGIWLGFTSLQILVLQGKRGQELAYVIGWFLMPFSGAYYPVEVLPHWGQVISKFLPMSYVFTGMRGYVMHNQDPTLYLLKGYALGALYAMGALAFFVYCFNRSKRNGLARLAD
jgi:ABC-2 type transport system permease protein